MVPGLAWLDQFCASTGLALDQGLTYRVVPTAVPLVYIVKVMWQQRISGDLVNKVWNLFQIWAAKNDTIPQGKIMSNSVELVVSVALKQRLGPPKKDHPAL